MIIILFDFKIIFTNLIALKYLNTLSYQINNNQLKIWIKEKIKLNFLNVKILLNKLNLILRCRAFFKNIFI